MTTGSPRRPHPRPSALAVDGLLFAGSAVFAVLLWANSDLSPHRDWGRDAAVGYAACAVAAGVLCVVRPSRALLARVALTAVCFVFVALVPMALMVHQRAQAGREVHVLPEVGVIERAGHALVGGHDPYVAQLVGARLIGQVPGVPRYEAFFPYFPLMLAFGLPSTVHWLGSLGDGRLWMALLSIGLFLVALRLARAPPERSLRAAQVFLVLPTGAVFLAGGGDDLPVLALSLVGLVAVARRRELTSGVAFGVAMAMKLTAWPLGLLCLLIVRDRDGHRSAGRTGAIMAAIVAVVVVPFFVWDPHTFYENVIAFPLGLSGIDSPAASPLPGHLLVTVVPSVRRVLLVGLGAVGVPVLAWWLWRRPPRDVAGVCRLTAVIAIVVMCAAPATRVGYVVYPVNLLVWSWLFTSPVRRDALRPTEGVGVVDAARPSSVVTTAVPTPGAEARSQLKSETWNSRNV
ncbi:MAG TPA: glycosyltransferase family 87 protein [Acidimicrobiales bacterium]|nr:glycosyltransferase family 87 protein [Acidimicrobiales bacterium]